MKLRVEEQWQAFVKACFPAGLHPQQLQDLKRTFYAGFTATLLIFADVPEAEEIRMINEVQAELYVFNEDVKAGRQ